MQLSKKHFDLILSMRNQGLANYVIPGLDSHMIGGAEHGCVRLFQCSRDHQEQITPHSHRFDFSAQVLRGSVNNFIWKQSPDGDKFLVSEMIYSGAPGEYSTGKEEVKRMAISESDRYAPGDWYHMKAEEIHSIEFSRDAAVLFFEGPQVSDRNVILQPHTAHGTIRTFKTEPWMFQKISGK